MNVMRKIRGMIKPEFLHISEKISDFIYVATYE